MRICIWTDRQIDVHLTPDGSMHIRVAGAPHYETGAQALLEEKRRIDAETQLLESHIRNRHARAELAQLMPPEPVTVVPIRPGHKR